MRMALVQQYRTDIRCCRNIHGHRSRNACHIRNGSTYRRSDSLSLEAKGDTAEKIGINSNEFARYCEQRQCKYDTAALRNFMLVKGSDKI
jgi:hypothetical protein